MLEDSNLQNISPAVLDHDLNQYFPELLKFNSLEETEKSAVYQKIKPTVERILNAIVQENYSEKSVPSASADGSMSRTENSELEPPAYEGGTDFSDNSQLSTLNSQLSTLNWFPQLRGTSSAEVFTKE